MTRAELARVLGASPAAAGGGPARTWVEAKDPEQFRRAFAAAVAAGGEVFLGDARWTAGAREEGETGGEPGGAGAAGAREGLGWLMIPTGGSGGRLRWARHDERTIEAAVAGFCGHFGVQRVHAAGMLPLHHVSGLMAWLRCALTGGTCLALEGERIAAGEFADLPARAEGWFLSLVPTQLERLLRRPAAVAWLRGFRTIFVGGGPAWPDLLARAADARLPVALTYGMTETAAMVTALRPEEFLAGDRDAGRALPHAAVAVGPGGSLRVAGESLFRGYWPEFRPERWHETEDLGRIDERGHLHVTGRRDEVIITGGEKVDPREVEAVLRATGEFGDVAVVGVPHPEWGAEVVAVYPETERPALERVRAALERELAPFKRPKRWVPLGPWPRTAAGKLNRAELVRRAGAA